MEDLECDTTLDECAEMLMVDLDEATPSTTPGYGY